MKSLIDFEIKAYKKSKHSVIINLLKLPSRLKRGSVASDSNPKKNYKNERKEGLKTKFLNSNLYLAGAN